MSGGGGGSGGHDVGGEEDEEKVFFLCKKCNEVEIPEEERELHRAWHREEGFEGFPSSPGPPSRTVRIYRAPHHEWEEECCSGKDCCGDDRGSGEYGGRDGDVGGDGGEGDGSGGHEVGGEDEAGPVFFLCKKCKEVEIPEEDRDLHRAWHREEENAGFPSSPGPPSRTVRIYRAPHQWESSEEDEGSSLDLESCYCYNCGEPGHTSRECPSQQREEGGGEQECIGERDDCN